MTRCPERLRADLDAARHRWTRRRSRRAQLLEDADENIRGWAIQLELEDGQVSDDVQARLDQMAQARRFGPGPPVPGLGHAATARGRALERSPTSLIAHGEDAEDHNLPLMIWYGMEPLVPQDPARALHLAETSQIAKIRQFIIRRAAANLDGLDELLTWTQKLPSDRPTAAGLGANAEGLRGPSGNQDAARVAADVRDC